MYTGSIPVVASALDRSPRPDDRRRAPPGRRLRLCRLRLGGAVRAAEPPLRRLLLVAGWAVGAGLTLYALANVVEHALMAIGAIDTPAGLGTRAVPWHLALWDPFWLLGGVLFLAAAWTSTRSSL